MQPKDICIDEGADWTALGGHIRFRPEPTEWRRKSSGAWERKELVPYGRASPEYRSKYFRCPECNTALLPTNVRYRFGCCGCGLVFGTGFGGLWGYPAGHSKAMYLTDHVSAQREL